MDKITINGDKSQSENQKTTPVIGSSIDINNLNTSLPGVISQIWLSAVV